MKALMLVLMAVALPTATVRYVFAQRNLDTDGGFVTVADLPKLVDRLAKTGKDGAFWVVLVPGTARSDGLAANLQVSIERGVIGMDWVLIAQRNIEDSSRFLALVTVHKLRTKKLSGNNVRYLRVEPSENLAALCAEVLTKMYGVAVMTNMRLIITGFDWP
jgi:hypothetical protein